MIPTSNHNVVSVIYDGSRLYIFWFLHQTTTSCSVIRISLSCISFDSYIKPQLKILKHLYSGGCISFDSYIKPQLKSEIRPDVNSCISFDSYIKPQLLQRWGFGTERCISFDSYIKPQPLRVYCSNHLCCISFDSYIKPQLRYRDVCVRRVVYLLIPTSNHNLASCSLNLAKLYIFWFLHQTTTAIASNVSTLCCISFDSYIKPQLCIVAHFGKSVVYLLIPTSNHNTRLILKHTTLVVYLLIPTSNHNPLGYVRRRLKLYIFWFLHQTTTSGQLPHMQSWLYIFWFLHQTTTFIRYLPFTDRLYIFWFLHQTTTLIRLRNITHQLYIFWFLHQTTTAKDLAQYQHRLYIFWFLHQTTTMLPSRVLTIGCISFDSYIKPQPFVSLNKSILVVYLLIPTSNHNCS